MAAYLHFHQLERSPFEGQVSLRPVLATAALRQAYAEIRSSLDDAAPRICVSGGEGIGKTTLARALPKLLAEDSRTAVIRDPSFPWAKLRASIGRQLGLPSAALSRRALMGARGSHARLVLAIDRAELLSAECLEHLDILLGYKDEAGDQLLHCILLANLEGAARGEDLPLVWWLDELTTRQLRFTPIPEQGMRSYIDKHLEKAGWRGANLFSDDATVAIHRYTGGVPGTVSSLCEELLVQAAESDLGEIDAALVAEVWGDDAPREGAGDASDTLVLEDPITALASSAEMRAEREPATPPPGSSHGPDARPPASVAPGTEQEDEDWFAENGPDDEAAGVRAEDALAADWSGAAERARWIRNGVAAALTVGSLVAVSVWIAGSDEPSKAGAQQTTQRAPKLADLAGRAPDALADPGSTRVAGPMPADLVLSKTLSDVTVGAEPGMVATDAATGGPPAYEPWTAQRPSAFDLRAARAVAAPRPEPPPAPAASPAP